MYAKQIESVTSGGITSLTLLVSVSIGLAILVGLGFLRIIYNIPLYRILLILYVLIFILAIFAKKNLLRLHLMHRVLPQVF